MFEETIKIHIIRLRYKSYVGRCEPGGASHRLATSGSWRVAPRCLPVGSAQVNYHKENVDILREIIWRAEKVHVWACPCLLSGELWPTAQWRISESVDGVVHDGRGSPPTGPQAPGATGNNVGKECHNSVFGSGGTCIAGSVVWGQCRGRPTIHLPTLLSPLSHRIVSMFITSLNVLGGYCYPNVCKIDNHSLKQCSVYCDVCVCSVAFNTNCSCTRYLRGPCRSGYLSHIKMW